MRADVKYGTWGSHECLQCWWKGCEIENWPRLVEPWLEAPKAWQRLETWVCTRGHVAVQSLLQLSLLAGSRSRGRRRELCGSAGLPDRSEGRVGVQRIQGCVTLGDQLQKRGQEATDTWRENRKVW